MRNKIVFILILICWGCTMNSDDLDKFIVGKWESGKRETEMGVIIIKVTFTDKNTFKTECFFGEESTPLIMEGVFKLIGSHLIATSWNKGEPINISSEKNKLILEIKNEPPLILHRIKNIE